LSGQLLVTAGEASGDELAAAVVGRLKVPTFGLGGQRLAEEGTELVSRLTSVTTMGVAGPLARGPALISAGLSLLRQARRRRPRAALLVGFSEFNGWLGHRLRALKIPVLWYAPPQIWAWGTRRGLRFAAACDKVAVLLPFEQQLWHSLGKEAHFVGHPVAVEDFESKRVARDRLGLLPDAPALVLMPGSRPVEVERHLQSMLVAARVLGQRHGIQARLLPAHSLDETTLKRVRRRAEDAGTSCVEPKLDRLISAFDAALVKSGTGSLKCAVAGTVPIIVYRAGRLGERVRRHLVRVSHIGLPNIVLGERRFVELFGREVSAASMATAVEQVLSEPLELSTTREQLIARLLPTSSDVDPRTPPDRVAGLIEPWLA